MATEMRKMASLYPWNKSKRRKVCAWVAIAPLNPQALVWALMRTREQGWAGEQELTSLVSSHYSQILSHSYGIHSLVPSEERV